MRRSIAYLLTVIGLTSAVSTAERIQSEVKMNLDEFQEIFQSARLNEAELRMMEQKKRHEAEHQRKIKELDEAISRSKEAKERDRVATQQALFPDNFKVLSHTADGMFNASDHSSGVEGDVTSFAIEVLVRVMQPKWTVVPLANVTSMVASDWEVAWMADDNNASWSTLDPVADPDAMIMTNNEQQVLATSKAGMFKVKFYAHSRVRKDRKLNSVSLSSLLYPLSRATLTLCGENTNTLSEDGVTVKELSINPASAVLNVDLDKLGCARISATLPLQSTKFDIHWLDIVDTAKEEKTKPKSGLYDEEEDNDQTITVSHDMMHIIGEGVIQSESILQFETSESGIGSVTFNIVGSKGTRVTSVSGFSLSRWAAGQYNTTESTIPVQAFFKTSNLDSSFALRVNLESYTDAAMAKPKQELDLPRIECKGAIRQTGHIGIAKIASNVELHQKSALGLVRAEPTDISPQLLLAAGNLPIMFAYKYLNPSYRLVLNSTSHTAMETLESVVDRFHYEALVLDTNLMHSLLIVMKSSKLQYLEMNNIPDDAFMFTLIVNGVQTKPVRGANDSLLVPLLVGMNTGEINGGAASTSLELRYFTTQQAIGTEKGNIELSLPQVGIPISVVTTELILPKQYSYNFTGSFGDKSSDRARYSVPSAFSHVKGKRMVPRGYKFSRLDDLYESEDEMESKEGNIQMNIPQTGRSYFFERLFVVDIPLSIQVNYFHPPKSPALTFWGQVMSVLKK